MTKTEFSAVLTPSEIILICRFVAQPRFLIIIKVEQLGCLIFLWKL